MGDRDGGATILVVEDQAGVREALTAVLEVMGYRVLGAGSGKEALALFGEQEGAIDLVISDMVMADMSGVALHQKLRAERPELPMLIITGYPLEDDGQALIGEGIAGWMQKPVSIDELEEKVRRALGGGREK